MDLVTHVSKPKRSGGNDEPTRMNKLNNVRKNGSTHIGYKFYNSSRLFIVWGYKVSAHVRSG